VEHAGQGGTDTSDSSVGRDLADRALGRINREEERIAPSHTSGIRINKGTPSKAIVQSREEKP